MQGIFILDGGRRIPRADILIRNKEPGHYSGISANVLGAWALEAALKATEMPEGLVGNIMMGVAMPGTQPDGMYGAGAMGRRAGLPEDMPSTTVAKLCGSGARSIVAAAEHMLAGICHDKERPLVAVGGSESMDAPFCLYDYRGREVGGAAQKYGPIRAGDAPPDMTFQDSLLAGLFDPLAGSSGMAMANTAEELGRRYGVTREECDELALRSHQRARAARDNGLFDREIVPVKVQPDAARPPVLVKHDTHIMDKPSMAKMARLRPAFEPGGVITAANASAVVSGAAAMVVAREQDVKEYGLRPLVRLAGVGIAACDPTIMGWGPVPATKRVLESAGITGQAVDRVELNVAFAPQALACIRDFEEMGIDPGKVNLMGDAMSLGHPLGATGAILTLTCAYAMQREDERYGLVTMCIGGGQGISLILELD